MDVWIGIGGNIGDVQETIEHAIEAIANEPTTRVVARAGFYRTRPVGPVDQPDFLNTAIHIDTSMSPDALLAFLKETEAALGRLATVRWGPRAIDLDILVFGDRIIDTASLTIPHRQLQNRRFVLAPLADISPELVVPGIGRSARALLLELTDDPDAVRPA